VTFALGAVAFHQAYYLYSASAFAWCWVEHCAAAARRALTRGAESG
jgi:hypothetical protein